MSFQPVVCADTFGISDAGIAEFGKHFEKIQTILSLVSIAVLLSLT